MIYLLSQSDRRKLKKVILVDACNTLIQLYCHTQHQNADKDI